MDTDRVSKGLFEAISKLEFWFNVKVTYSNSSKTQIIKIPFNLIANTNMISPGEDNTDPTINYSIITNLYSNTEQKKVDEIQYNDQEIQLNGDIETNIITDYSKIELNICSKNKIGDNCNEDSDCESNKIGRAHV